MKKHTIIMMINGFLLVFDILTALLVLWVNLVHARVIRKESASTEEMPP